MTSLDVLAPASRRRFGQPGAGTPRLWVSLGLLALAALVGAAPGLFAPYSPTAINAGASLVGPGPAHWLGTDQLGRDILSRIIYGTSDALLIAFGSVLVGAGVGAVLGLLAGYFGGVVDNLVMRLTDIMLAIPALVAALAIVTILGQGVRDLVLAIGISEIPIFVRVSYGATLEARTRLFVAAARSVGAGHSRILGRHILPNIAGPILVMLSVDMGAGILAVAGLSFLGLGPPPPMPQWGSMVAQSQQYIPGAWWIAVAPGAAIVASVLTLNTLADELQRVLDPRWRVR